MSISSESNSGKKYQNQEWLNEQYHEKGRTQAEIANECGVSPPTIRNWMSQFNMETRSRGRRIERATYHKRSDEYRLWSTRNPKGGHDAVYVHRLLATLLVDDLSEMEGKHVHHKTHRRYDNRLEAIELMDPSEHSRHHAGGGEPEVPE